MPACPINAKVFEISSYMLVLLFLLFSMLFTGYTVLLKTCAASMLFGIILGKNGSKKKIIQFQLKSEQNITFPNNYLLIRNIFTGRIFFKDFDTFKFCKSYY